LTFEFVSSLRSALTNHANIEIEDPLEAVIGVPANSNSNQRFLTIEGFRLAGFHVAGVYEEPAAAGIEYAHRYRTGSPSRKRENLLVYDLGGGTFDCSVIRMSGNDHSVMTTSGISRLGGDDFDDVLMQLSSEKSSRNCDRFLEICRLAKERLNPNSKKILLNFEDREIAIPVDEFYGRCSDLIDRTVRVVEMVIARIGGEETLSGIYIVGGGSEFPPVSRALRARFGRRVRKSAYSHAATAVGLAILADSRSEVSLDRTFTRNFGVWRETESGAAASFDTIFPKGSPIPSRAVRRYQPVHNIGHFRYLECDEIDESDRPAGDMTPWDDILFPFEQLHQQAIANTPIQASPLAESAEVEETYTCDENGIIQATIRNLTAGYHYVYTLHR
jgi:molecular chaperone DnaK (HSP70)